MVQVAQFFFFKLFFFFLIFNEKQKVRILYFRNSKECVLNNGNSKENGEFLFSTKESGDKVDYYENICLDSQKKGLLHLANNMCLSFDKKCKKKNFFLLFDFR